MSRRTGPGSPVYRGRPTGRKLRRRRALRRARSRCVPGRTATLARVAVPRELARSRAPGASSPSERRRAAGGRHVLFAIHSISRGPSAWSRRAGRRARGRRMRRRPHHRRRRSLVEPLCGAERAELRVGMRGSTAPAARRAMSSRRFRTVHRPQPLSLGDGLWTRSSPRIPRARCLSPGLWHDAPMPDVPSEALLVTVAPTSTEQRPRRSARSCPRRSRSS